MTEQTDLRELRGRLRVLPETRRVEEQTHDDVVLTRAEFARLVTERGEAAVALVRMEELEALRTRLQVFLAAVGASTPDDHPWVVEARALANALRPCELATPAPAPQQGGER